MATIPVTVPDAVVPRIQAALPTVPVDPTDFSKGTRKLTAQQWLRRQLIMLVNSAEEDAVVADARTNKREELQDLFGPEV